MKLSFNFSSFVVELSHKNLEQMGEFTIFCMRAMSKGMTVDDISNIICIHSDAIKKQLNFVISRKYLTESYSLTESGQEVVEIFDYLVQFNQSKVRIVLDHFIRRKERGVLTESHKDLCNEATGLKVSDNLHDYKVKKIFEDMGKMEHIKRNIFKNSGTDMSKDLLDRNINNFIFKIVDDSKQSKYLNYEVSTDNFMNILEIDKNGSNDYISLNIPVLFISRKITSQVLSNEECIGIEEMFEGYSCFNLINGDVLDTSKSLANYNQTNLDIEPLIDKTGVLTGTIVNETCIPIKHLLLADIQIEFKEYNVNRFINMNNIIEAL